MEGIAKNVSVQRRKFCERLYCDRVQTPMSGPFSSQHLEWYNEQAWIPETRLEDFLEGEEHRPLCNTQFKTRGTDELHSKTTGAKLQSVKRYWCAYGPQDLRGKEEEKLLDARKFANGKAPLRYTTLTGYSVRRGCRCHFHVTRYEDRKEAVKITWKLRKHTDAQGRHCHGLLDPTAEFVNAQVAPRLSKRTYNFIERLIRAGISTSKIQQAHCRNLRNHWRDFYPNDCDERHRWSRDMMMSPRDVKAIRQSVLRKKVDFTTKDHCAVHTWVANNKDKVFLYQPRKEDHTPFILAWASDWQIQKASQFGHGRSVAMDATFGTNIWDLSLFTVLAYDNHQNGLPVAWALMEKHKSENLVLFLDALKNRVEKYRTSVLLEKDWTPISFMIDVASEEILALRAVWPGVPINLCLWHVRRAWTKNLLSKVKNPFNRADLNREMAEMMYNVTEDPQAESNSFMTRWRPSEPGFIDYYATFWHPKMERWMKQFRTYDHQNQNTNGAIERWHHTLKMHLRTEKSMKAGRSVIWLLGMLSDDLELFYWCMLSLKYQGAIKNKVKEGYVWASIHKARMINDSQVRYVGDGPDGARRAEVTTYKEDGAAKVHIVENYHTDNCRCTCGHSEQGNTCKHQIKVLLMDGYTEMKLFNLLGTKWGSCCGGLEYEYECIAEETVHGEEVEVTLPEEVDISFPLASFASLEEEEDPKDDAPSFQEYNVEYYLGIVQKGWDRLQASTPALRNQAVVKLRQWLQWVCDEEALSNPAELDDFPLTQFATPVIKENTLKRKKDAIERYWEKKNKGTRSKKVAPVGQTPSREFGVHEVTMEFSDGENSQGPCESEHELGSTRWEDIRSSTVKVIVEEVSSQADMVEENQRSSVGRVVLQPFPKNVRARENDTDMLQRLARESLNLNHHPMDHEANTPPTSPIMASKCRMVRKGNGNRKKSGGKASQYHSKVPDVSIVAGPKRRGRPPGSKNKAVGKENVRPVVDVQPIIQGTPNLSWPMLSCVSQASISNSFSHSEPRSILAEMLDVAKEVPSRQCFGEAETGLVIHLAD